MAASEQNSGASLEIMVPPDTERLRFRPLRTDDHDNVRAIYADPLALRFLPDLGKPGGVQRFIDRQRARYLEFGYGIWLIETLQDGQVAGDAGLTWQETDLGEVLEIGYGLRAPKRGKGLATEAALACLHFGFSMLGASRIASLVHPDNSSSMAVAQRVHRLKRRFVHPSLGEEYLMYYTEAGEHEIRA